MATTHQQITQRNECNKQLPYYCHKPTLTIIVNQPPHTAAHMYHLFAALLPLPLNRQSKPIYADKTAQAVNAQMCCMHSCSYLSCHCCYRLSLLISFLSRLQTYIFMIISFVRMYVYVCIVKINVKSNMNFKVSGYVSTENM